MSIEIDMRAAFAARGGPPMARELTARQAECVAVIRRSIEERGYPPTLREIGSAMGIGSTNGVRDHLRALQRKGILRIDDPRKARSIRLVGVRWEAVPC